MKIARVYLDCDLRCSFEGLMKVLKEDKIKTDNLGQGDLTLFMNRSATAFKLLAGKEYLAYYKNGHRRIPLEAIQYLPTFFNGTSFDLSKAVEKSVRTKLNQHK